MSAGKNEKMESNSCISIIQQKIKRKLRKKSLAYHSYTPAARHGQSSVDWKSAAKVPNSRKRIGFVPKKKKKKKRAKSRVLASFIVVNSLLHFLLLEKGID